MDVVISGVLFKLTSVSKSSFLLDRRAEALGMAGFQYWGGHGSPAPTPRLRQMGACRVCYYTVVITTNTVGVNSLGQRVLQ